MKIKAFQALERTFGVLADFFNGLRERCAVCPDCGRNRYTGQPCIIMRGIHDCNGD